MAVERCMNCNKLNRIHSKFCNHCGKPMGTQALNSKNIPSTQEHEKQNTERPVYYFIISFPLGTDTVEHFSYIASPNYFTINLIKRGSLVYFSKLGTFDCIRETVGYEPKLPVLPSLTAEEKKEMTRQSPDAYNSYTLGILHPKGEISNLATQIAGNYYHIIIEGTIAKALTKGRWDMGSGNNVDKSLLKKLQQKEVNQSITSLSQQHTAISASSSIAQASDPSSQTTRQEEKRIPLVFHAAASPAVATTNIQPAQLTLGWDIQTQQPVYLPEQERTYHTVIIGQTRFGKTLLLEQMVLADLKNDINAVLFDPHGDLTEDLLLQAASAHKADKVVLYEITADSSYIFNPVEVKNPNDPMEVSRTVDSLMQVFRKHWTSYAWGPRVEWVLSNCLRTLVANPGHTIDEIPLLLRDDAFRANFLPHITNPQVQEFWRWYRILESTRRPQDEWQLIESTLTRLSQFLANEWLVRILYQPTSTVNFDQIINKTAGQLTIFSLPIGRLGEEPAALLGSLLLGKLATTIFGRIDYGAQLPRLHIYIDELSRFSLPITARLWTEGGKYNIGLTATLQTLSQLQDEENKSAILQAGNHICFQLIGPSDAQVMAAQMPIPDPTSLMKPEPMLLYSQTAVEDIWKKGHPNKTIQAIRDRYYNMVGELERLPKEEYWWYGPPEYILKEHPEWRRFTDWDMYRSSAAMVKQGIQLLDRYYYDWMNHRYSLLWEIANEEVITLLNIVECFAGVMGMRPIMEPYIPEDQRVYLLQKLKDHADYLDQKHHLIDSRTGEKHHSVKKLEELLTMQSIPSVVPLQFISHLQQFALESGRLSQYEVEKLIQWRIRILIPEEGEYLKAFVRDCANYTLLKQQYGSSYDPPSARPYGASLQAMSIVKLSGDYIKNVPATEQKYDTIALERTNWQANELFQFIHYGCRICGSLLEKEPLHVPSTSYRDVEYSRRTYADVRDELAQRLVSLPRYEAIAALVSESVVKHIKTLPLPSLSAGATAGAQQIRTRSRQQVNKPMQEIMDALKKRNRPADPGNLPTPKPHI